MQYTYLTPSLIDSFIDNALTEDIGDGDHTSLASIPAGKIGRAQLILKDEGILAGIEIAKHIFDRVDAGLIVTINMQDGDPFKHGQIALTVSGSVSTLR